MSQPFLGEIKIASFNFAARGWALCNGQLLPINQNQALFSILGTTYGGDGRVTFALPNLQGRIPLHTGNGFVVGELGGQATHTLNVNELPQHGHLAHAQTQPAAAGFTPAGALQASGADAMYATTPNATMATSPAAVTGNSQPHENQAPYLVVSMMIALQGIFPSQT